MTWVWMVAIGVAAWCVLPLPLAIAVGRAFRAGAGPEDAPGAAEAPVAVGDQTAVV